VARTRDTVGCTQKMDLHACPSDCSSDDCSTCTAGPS
jgi:hypothetical protein